MAALILCLGLAVWELFPPGVWHDDGVYVLLGKALGEGHGLRQEKNQKDYQRRILAWFGHYLKGEPAEPWITEGKSFLEREAELKRFEALRGGSRGG